MKAYVYDVNVNNKVDEWGTISEEFVAANPSGPIGKSLASAYKTLSKAPSAVSVITTTGLLVSRTPLSNAEVIDRFDDHNFELQKA